MDQNCQDCLMLKNLSKELTEFKEEVKDRVMKVENDVSEIQKVSAAREQQYKYITDTVKEIKESIKDILEEIKSLKAVPAGKWEKLTSGAALAIVAGVIGVAVGKLF